MSHDWREEIIRVKVLRRATGPTAGEWCGQVERELLEHVRRIIIETVGDATFGGEHVRVEHLAFSVLEDLVRGSVERDPVALVRRRVSVEVRNDRRRRAAVSGEGSRRPETLSPPVALAAREASDDDRGDQALREALDGAGKQLPDERGLLLRAVGTPSGQMATEDGCTEPEILARLAEARRRIRERAASLLSARRSPDEEE